MTEKTITISGAGCFLWLTGLYLGAGFLFYAIFGGAGGALEWTNAWLYAWVLLWPVTLFASFFLWAVLAAVVIGILIWLAVLVAEKTRGWRMRAMAARIVRAANRGTK